MLAIKNKFKNEISYGIIKMKLFNLLLLNLKKSMKEVSLWPYPDNEEAEIYIRYIIQISEENNLSSSA